jgi:cytochrome c556
VEKWTKADNKEYKRQTALFEFANEELVRQANAKNVEGATLAYNRLTVTCVQCHRVVRDAK